MTYYKKLERDEARNLHLKEMERIKKSMTFCGFDKWLELDHQLTKMQKQLELYDREMGYKKEL